MDGIFIGKQETQGQRKSKKKNGGYSSSSSTKERFTELYAGSWQNQETAIPQPKANNNNTFKPSSTAIVQEDFKRFITITRDSTLVDLMNKYEEFENDMVKDMFDNTGRDPILCDQALEEMMILMKFQESDPIPQTKQSIPSKVEYPKMTAAQKESPSHKGAKYPVQPAQAQNEGKKKAEVNNWSDMNDRYFLENFNIEDYYQGEDLTKEDIDEIVRLSRTSPCGVNQSEEHFLQDRYRNDLVLLQKFIMNEQAIIGTLDKKSQVGGKSPPTMPGLTASEFPSIVDNELIM